MKKSSESSQQEKLPHQKRGVLKNYDFNAMPELNDSQIKSLKRVSRQRHEILKKAVKAHIGRPKKDPESKENIVSIRFSKKFLDQLKQKALSEGYSRWQTYAKRVLEESIGYK